MSDDDNKIDWRKVSPTTIERMRAYSERKFHKPMTEEEITELPEDSMRLLRAEAERRGVTIYEVIEWLGKKTDA